MRPTILTNFFKKLKISSQKEVATKGREVEVLAHQLNPYSIVAKTDLNGKITFVNDLFCNVCGYSREELIGHNYHKLNSGFHSKEFFKEMWESVLNKKVWRGEIKNKKKDGTYFWVDTTVAPELDSQGNIIALISFIFDITARKTFEDRLIRSEAKLRQLFDQSADPVMTLYPPDWSFKSVNQAALKLFGIESSELFCSMGPGTVSPEFQQCGTPSKDLAEKMIGIALKEGSHFFNWIHKKMDGSLISCTVLLSKIVEGEDVSLYATVRDITSQKRIQKQLVEAQAISKIGSWSLNLLTREQIWSEEHYKIFEIDYPQPQDQLYTMYRDRIHPDDLSKLDQLIAKAISDGENFVFDHRVYLENGQRIKYVQGIGKVQKDANGVPVSLTGTCRDRTQNVEQELRYQNILQSMEEGLVVQDSKGNIFECNAAATKILEMDLLNRHSADPVWQAVKENGETFPGDEHPAMVSLRTGKPVSNVIMGLKFLPDKIKWIKINAIPILKGSERNVITTFTDISELVLTKEENQFTLDTLEIGVWKFNPNSQDLIWDASMYKLYDLNPADFSGHYSAWEKLLTPETKKDAVEAVEKALSGEKELNMTFEVYTKNNVKRAIGSRGKVIRNSSGDPQMLYGINWDKTKEVELEMSLEIERTKSLHNSKLATIGQLAAGVGHEINNPLAIISGSLLISEKVLKDSGRIDPFISERFSQIQSAITRIANIVKGLRIFARSDDYQLSHFNLSELITESVAMLNDIYLKDEVELTFSSDNRDYHLYGNRGRIQQALINLISNAKDASENKVNRKVKVTLVQSGNEVCIEVMDNGSGIPEKVQDKIFNPFFTTKEINKGTGIGLSVVSTIVKEHQGRIIFKTVQGEGTQFLIYLPLTESKKNDSFFHERPTVVTPNFKCNVLIVDDEPELRDIFKYLISKFCSDVKTASDGLEAMKMMNENVFDLIISDVKMPNMDGFKLLKAIRNDQNLTQPKFVFFSGNVEMSEAEEELIIKYTSGILTKPSTEEQILVKLKELFPTT